jgi:4-hydroxy-tetrahydrodipicolinate synthase
MYRGVLAALVTPLTGSGEVSVPDVTRLAGTLRPYVDGLVPALSTGEGWALSDRQWQQMVEATVRAADGLPVLAGALRPTTAETLRRARAAARLDVDAVVATTPYGRDVSQEEMYRHYASLGEQAGVPVVVYHESQLSGNSLETKTLLRICALPGVVAVKDSAGDPAATRRLLAAGPGVPVLQGLEHLCLECGDVDGYVLALANVEPEVCAALLARPTADLADRVAVAVERYGLDRPDWYRALKAELYRRSVLTSEQTVEAEGAAL